MDKFKCSIFEEWIIILNPRGTISRMYSQFLEYRDLNERPVTSIRSAVEKFRR